MHVARPTIGRFKVFISYFSGDRCVARQIEKEIQRLGVDTFFDVRDLETGDVTDEMIREAIVSSDELLVLLTPEALDRRYVWTEIGAAWVQQKRIVGILYRVSAGDVVTREGMPAFIKGTQLRNLEDLDVYLGELRRRARP